MLRPHLGQVWRRLSSSGIVKETSARVGAPKTKIADLEPADLQQRSSPFVPKSSILNAYPTPSVSRSSAFESIAKGVEEARRAVAVASEAGSDDLERDQSVALARNALARYGKHLDGLKKTGSDAERRQFEAKVGQSVEKLKEELFMSRKPRVWMVVRDWF